ncbi:ABATE domain-containing protein [Zavarzinia sp.]|uniref:CGNR zinc finger domain-containing protein n=1 Tax=Zavarzinia sp. TaxID=2027920 RepID=UPI003561E0E7
MAAGRPAPFFIGDDLALDFLNSIATPVDLPVEWLADGADLLDWLAASGAVPAAEIARFRAGAVLDELDLVAARARGLREWFRGFVAAHAGRPLEAAALAELGPVNGLLERDRLYRRVEASGDRLALAEIRRFETPDALLIPLAAAMAELLTRRDMTLVRHCEGQGCTLWFYDTSKSHGRRWCSMAACGNRAKASAHRARQRATPMCE